MSLNLALNLQRKYGTIQDLHVVTVFMTLDVQFTIKICYQTGS